MDRNISYGLPSPPEMASRLEAMVRDDSSATILSYLLPAELLLEWAHSVGVATDETLRAAVSPVPPRSLREIVAAPEEAVFLWTGARDLQGFKDIYQDLGTPPEGRKPRVLDFGCGCGRMTRLLDMDDNFETFGSDINRSLVSWCEINLHQVTTKLNGEKPPLDFDSDFFDLAYTLSIFTHLPEDSAARWLDELARVCAKGATVIITTHGYSALDTIRNSPVHQQMFGVDENGTDDLIRRLPTEGFIFIPYEADVIAAADAGSSYGNVFIDPGYAANHWNTTDFEIVKHIPAGLRGWQDVFVLRRR